MLSKLVLAALVATSEAFAPVLRSRAPMSALRASSPAMLEVSTLDQVTSQMAGVVAVDGGEHPPSARHARRPASA